MKTSSDAIQQLFDWVDGNHCLQKTKLIINNASKQIEEMEAELVTLRKLVREMGEAMRFFVEQVDEAWLADVCINNDEAKEIISRPEVKKILDSEP